jgi:hypothetical protein
MNIGILCSLGLRVQQNALGDLCAGAAGGWSAPLALQMQGGVVVVVVALAPRGSVAHQLSNKTGPVRATTQKLL